MTDQPSLAERITANHEAVRSGAPQRRIRVPEWHLTLHAAELTADELEQIDAELTPYRKALRRLLIQARDASGEPVISDADGRQLFAKGVGAFGPEVVLRVAAELAGK